MTQPSFKLHDDQNGIDIGLWHIHALHDSIASTDTEERLSQELNIKLPAMLFPENYIRLSFPSPERPSFELTFKAVDALALVGEADPSIQVKAAGRWKNKQDRDDVQITTIEHASDWTFSTKYAGTVSINGEVVPGLQQQSNNVEHSAIRTTAPLSSIDYDALRDTTLPILHSAQIILFEDELDDNGIASFKIRIRVMPTFYFILARFFLRVDGVLVRAYDTRYFHRFGSDVVVRETLVREADIRTTLKDVHPSILVNPDEVVGKLPVISRTHLNIGLDAPS